jgi:8-oxo-dGTP pyrophosphatase MutT (NUDIX family)
MATPRTLHFSTDFCISCGTVTVDIQAKKALLIFDRLKGEYLLPKGRRNIGETLEAAAVRETFEETGIRCRLLPHSFPTLATQPADAEADAGKGGEDLSKDGNERLTTEPIAVQQRASRGVWKIIFWFVAEADSTVDKIDGTQEEWEQYDTLWVDVKDARQIMSREDDREILGEVVELVFGL